ncbi:MAG: Grx4 family monothiol glutaredoxin [Alcaligenaceae bacterium]|nr:Grx4 family monothiol glutaredoxin [Alcaligenaceae bacterium]
MSEEVKTFIENTLKQYPVVLFMKGTASSPQCGFSAKAVDVLRQLGTRQLATVNVLDSMEVREGIKQYADWPTIPQLYVKGEFIGGCDIMLEMFESGELETLLEEAGAFEVTA